MNEQVEEQVLSRLRDLASRLDPVPADVVAAARAAFITRTLDAELAELVFDSWVDEHALAGVRASSGSRMLTFDGAGLSVEVQVNQSAPSRLVGQVVPPQQATVEVRQQRGSVTVAADDLGRFEADVVPGPVSLRCRPAAGTAIVTDWIVV